MDKNIITIDTIDMLNKLINDIKNSEYFCDKFKFSNYDYKYIMLKELKINIKSFDEKYYYHSKKSKIHISESEDGSFLISTYGMIIYNKRFNSEKEKIIYAFESQTEVLEILLEKVDQLLKKRNIYDIDGYNYNYLMKLSTGLTNNYLFFLELFVKSYLAINDEKYPPTHNLKELLKKMESVIIKKNHKNTYFNAEIVHQFSEVVKLLNSSDEKFIEQYVKYNDSLQPSFSAYNLKDLKKFVSLCEDSIISLFYSCEDIYFRPGFYERLIQKVTSEEEKNIIKDNYSFLVQ